MSHCINPLWPCALTGAVSALSGFKGLAVVIHGSSGCYYYPATLLHRDLHSTFLVEQEVVFGTGERLIEVIEAIRPEYQKIAVVNSCVPSVMGEDIKTILEGFDVIVIESPGFMGDFEAGYHAAVRALPVRLHDELPGVNIEGINLIDPFANGNQREAERFLDLMSIDRGGISFCNDVFHNLDNVPGYFLSVNPDLSVGRGKNFGSLLGIEAITSVIRKIADAIESADPGPAEDEIRTVEERLFRASDKYLKRYDPPSVAVFSTYSYCTFAADTLKRYLDADIVYCGSRNPPPPDDLRVKKITSLPEVEGVVCSQSPDLVLGSSFEQSVAKDAAFVGLTPPIRGEVRLLSRPLAGTEGVLGLMEAVLNACMDRKKWHP